MARLRLLGVATAVVLAMSVVSCARCYGSRKVEVPRLAGQILDKRTGKPIEGMAVYQFYETFNRRVGTHGGSGSRDFLGTTTDREGRFAFPAHIVAEALKNHVDIAAKPSVVLFHREYGGPLVLAPEDRAQWESIVWEVEPDVRTLRQLADDCTAVCAGLDDGEIYADCCFRACGDIPNCKWATAR